ncbi:MAG TPA: gliding motility-associated protein GldE [Prolixibacteraceae bacterium]|nr:gliding motility-associated protein GldE [Prolixibacteraceae bacterium]
MDTDSIPLIFTLGWDITFYPISLGIIVGFLVIIILLICSALISGSEVAFFSMSPGEKDLMKESKSKSHDVIKDLLLIPDKLLATILIANNFINVGIIILSTYLFHQTVNFENIPLLGFLIQVVLITFTLLLFGEILPKIYASNYTLSVAEVMARPLYLLSKFFTPISSILIRSTSIVNKQMAKRNKNISIDELSQALELTSDEDISEDKDILEGIIKFGSTDVDQIMTPRTDVVSIEFSISFDKVIQAITESGYSRIPVYKETFDNVEGILYVKDLIPHIDKPKTFKWQSLIRPSFFIPENKKIDDLLKEFQKSKVHMAIVVDEYGGTSGLITLEDILEEIVGDIIDEFDEDDQLFTKINETTYIFDGKTQLNDFFRINSLDNHFLDKIKGEADTLAGLLLEMKGDFPKMHEKLTFKNIDFIVEAVDKRRIKKIKIIFNNNPE